jgi:hypothetical protein
MKRFDTDTRHTEILNENGAFFAFSQTQFNDAKTEGVEYEHLFSGLICPKNNSKKLMDELNAIFAHAREWELANNTKKEIIWHELANHECQIVGSWDDAYQAVKHYGITEDEVKAEWGAYWDNCVENDYF